MARKAQRREQPLGELTAAQILHLLVGADRYRYKGFRLPAVPFESEDERRRLWEENRELLLAYCKQEIPEDVRRELLIPDRIKVWTIAAVPHAEREYGATAEVEKYFETKVNPVTLAMKASRMQGVTNVTLDQNTETTTKTTKSNEIKRCIPGHPAEKIETDPDGFETPTQQPKPFQTEGTEGEATPHRKQQKATKEY